MKKRMVILFIILVVSVGLLVYCAQHKNKGDELKYSGTIEATEANLSFQVAGHVLSVQAKEGISVQKGDVLAELDAEEFKARFDQAQSGLTKALKAREQIEILLDIYRTTLPADVKRAEANVTIANNMLADAQKNYDRYKELYEKAVVTEKERDVVKLAYDNAVAKVDESEAALRQSNGSLRRIYATEKDIEGARAQEQLAKATLEQVQIQLGYTKLIAPFAGIITSRNVEPGEVVNPGREVLTLSDLSRVDLKIYVDETNIAHVKPGQNVDVKVDTFPDKVYAGQVSYISPEAEFTPKIIQTTKERVKLVYLVKVSIPNPNFELKTGMPADAYLK